MIIEYLADNKQAIPTLAQWFYDEWAYLHPDRTYADVEDLITERAQTGKIPVALVAYDGNELLGTVCLKVQDMDTHPELTPWLAGLYVSTPRRHEGIGIALISAIEEEAFAIGVSKLYLYTPESESFYAKRGWQVKKRTEYHGHAVTLMEKKIIL